MAEEYDPLQRMGQGNAYDGLVAGRTNKLKKAAAASAFPVGIVVYIVFRVILAGASAGNRTPPPNWEDDIRRTNGDLQRQLDALQRQRLDGIVFPPANGLLREDDQERRLRVEIAAEELLIADQPPGADLQDRRRRLTAMLAKLALLQARKASGAAKDQEPVGNPVLVGPPEELKGPLKRQ